MKFIRAMTLLVFLNGCVTPQEPGGFGLGEPGLSPSPGAKPALKKELPWLNGPNGQMRTTLFYGPWQCRQQFMNQCQAQCTQEGYSLMGCIWLADLKFDWKGSLFLLPVPVEAGSRYGIYHCCCNYPTRTRTDNEAARQAWKNVMKSFRKSWSEQFGEWPTEEDGVSWPGHHIQDLWHGGDPVDSSNVFPAQPRAHDLYTKAYPVCYSGQAPWNTVGSDLPYTDY